MFAHHRKTLLSVLVLVLVTVVLGGTVSAQQPEMPPITSQAVYVTMRDGVEIAVDVYFPPEMTAGQQYPTLMRTTRYWRSLQNLGIENLSPDTIPLVLNGFVVVRVDARGSGASGGSRPVEWSADEIADYGEVIKWITEQPWSNGRVGAYGVSYDGNTAELSTVPNHPALRAVAPQYADFDPQMYLAMPGGVFNQNFIQQWSDSNVHLDSNDVCYLAGASSDQECAAIRATVPGVRWVDSDPDGAHLAELLAERNNANVYDLLSQMEYRDSTFGDTGLTFATISPYGNRDAIESSNTPMNVWVSWLDAATIDGTLSRYLTFSNPQQVIIGAWSHGGGHNVDPFAELDALSVPTVEEQFGMMVEFFAPYLVSDDAPVAESSIRYYTMNSGEWHTTTEWPPEGFKPQTWYFAADHTLTTAAPMDATGSDEYPVDFTAATGDTNRWVTQLDGADVVYPDRAEEDQKLLIYTSAPLETDIEITGSPIITLYVASTETDGAFHVYLEDVAPDGRVTYITEGIIRAIHRAVSDAQPPYAQLGPYHSYLEADSTPLVPGETTEISFNLYATSVRLEAGHSLRVALAGADASMFERYPAEGDPVITVERNSVYASHIELPMKAH